MKEVIIKILPFTLHFLNSDFSIWRYESVPINTQEAYVVIKKLDLCRDNMPRRFSSSNGAVAATQVCESLYIYSIEREQNFEELGSDYNETFKNIKNDFSFSKKIKGFEVYLVNSNKKVWISKADWEFLTDDNSV